LKQVELIGTKIDLVKNNYVDYNEDW